jgi:hypothetical protein
MCPMTLLPLLGFCAIGFGVFGLIASFFPRCEYPERRLAAPFAKTIGWSGVGFLLLALGGMLPWVGSCSTCSIRLPCPISLLLSLILAYVFFCAVKLILSPYYWRYRLAAWANHNGFTLLEYGKMHSATGDRPCFRAVLRDAQGKDHKAEVTLGSNGGFNLNHVDLLWLD